MKKVLLSLCMMLGSIAWSPAQNGLHFDGVNDLVQTNCPGVLGMLNRTFEAWVFISPGAPTSNMAILDYGANIAGSRNTFIVTGNGDLRYISGGTNANIQTASNVVPLNQWVHVAFVLNNGIGYLYVNGSQLGTGSLSSVNTPGGNQTVLIGERVSGGSIPFMGALDEIRIWNVARSAAEIQANMNAEYCTTPPNLLLYLKLNEGTAGGNNAGITSAADNSGNAYSATLSNFSLTGATSNWVTGSGISNGSTTSSVQVRACDSYSLTPNSIVYTASGIYTEVLSGANAQGCDSIVTLDLTIDTIDNTVTQNGIVLTAHAVGVNYQWVVCPMMTPISGANSQSYTATNNGDYAVIVSDSLCTDTSACYTVSSIGISEHGFGDDLRVFPNPAHGEFFVDLGRRYGSATITITDLAGKRILANSYGEAQLLMVDFEEAPGIYLLTIESENRKAFIRLVNH